MSSVPYLVKPCQYDLGVHVPGPVADRHYALFLVPSLDKASLCPNVIKGQIRLPDRVHLHDKWDRQVKVPPRYQNLSVTLLTTGMRAN